MRKIKDVSRISGLSKRTLQFYDEKGLLSPKRTRQNYRLYSKEDLKKLWEILVFKSIGFELKEIKELLEDKGRRPEILDLKLQQVHEKKLELERIENVLEHVTNHGIPCPEGDKTLVHLATELIEK